MISKHKIITITEKDDDGLFVIAEYYLKLRKGEVKK